MLKFLFIITSILNFISCKPADISNLQIKNGKEISENEYKAIVPIYMQRSNNENQFGCTGTFLNDTTLLTAAHCIFASGELMDIYVKVNDEYIKNVNSFYTQQGESILKKYFFLNNKMINTYRQLYQEYEKLLNKYQTLKSQYQDPQQLCQDINNNILSAYTKDTNIPNLKIQLTQDIKNLNAAKNKYFKYQKLDWLNNDIALVVFPKNTGNRIVKDSKFYEINTNSIYNGTAIQLIGYGANIYKYYDNIQYYPKSCQYTTQIPTGSKIKRTAFQTISNKSNNYFEIKANPYSSEANVLPGDSGGPVILCENRQNCTNKIIAVNSFGHHTVSHYVSLYPNTTAQSLFENAIQCSNPPCAENFKGSGIPMNGKDNNNGLFVKIKSNENNANGVELFISTSSQIETVQICKYSVNQDDCNKDDYQKTQYFGLLNNERKIFKIAIQNFNNENQIKLISYDNNNILKATRKIKIMKKT